MCGFVGIASKSELEDIGSWTKIANKQIKHRGPDDSGYWVSEDNKVELAHRRLAVVDISYLAAQPMSNESFGLTIAFNGEIYNYKEIREDLKKIGYSFKSSSDTEVILAAFKEWGKECVKIFNGMFAFAIYDSKNQELFIARDRAGEKPLFYCADQNSISFSSELKGLIKNKKITREVDKKSLDCFLSFGFVPGKKCIYSEINKLEAGSWLTFNTSSGKIVLEKYWEIPNSANKFKRENDLLTEFGSLI
jgi:Asparagine synthase (glutamine-hydrolyzing)